MSDAQKAAALRQRRQTQEVGLLDQIVEQGRLARDPASRDRGKDLVKKFVSQVLEGDMTVSKDAEAMINARIAQIDHLISLQLNEVLHHPIFQQLEGTLARIEVPAGSERDRRRPEDQDPQCRQEGAAEGPAAGARVRSERAVQEGIRRRIRRLRRRSVRRADRRLSSSAKRPEDIELLERISQVAAAAHAPFLTGADPELFNLDSYTQPRCAARPRQGVRHDGVRQVEVVPRRAKIPVMSAWPASRAGAPAVRQGHGAGGRLRLRRKRGRHGSQQVPLDECGLGAGRAVDPGVRACMAGVLRSAASKAAAWWRDCRCTTSIPTKATSR